MKRDVKLEAWYPESPARVWQALTDPRALEEWLMENDFAPRVGHKFMFRANPQWGWDGKTYCEVLEVVPHQRLVYTWEGGGMSTQVAWSLAPHRGGTQLKLEHTGFDGLRNVFTSFLLGSGWKKMLRSAFKTVLGRTDESGYRPGPVVGCHAEAHAAPVSTGERP
jgi:uncharacterized protein YndB with AHSA1/START domain